MNKYIKTVFIVILVLLAAIAGLDHLDKALFLRDIHFEATRKNFYERKKDVEVLFLGTSSMRDGISPELIGENVFNYSLGAEPIICTYFRLKDHIGDMPNLKIVVLEIHPARFSSIWWTVKRYYYHFTMRNVIEMYEDIGISAIKEKLLLINPFRILQRSEMDKFFWHVRTSLKRGDSMERTFYRERVKVHNDGWRSVSARQRVKPVERKDIIRYYEDKDIFDKTFLLYYEKLLALCAENNVAVITVRCPIAGGARDVIEQYVTEEEFREKIIDNPRFARYVTRHLDHSDMDLGPEHFVDPEHLNKNGAGIFSARIQEELKPYWR